MRSRGSADVNVGSIDDRLRHNPDYEASRQPVDFYSDGVGPDQITIHFFDCHGSEDPAQHVGSLTVPDYGPFDSEWEAPSPQQIAGWMWNLRAALSSMGLFVMGPCFAIVGPDGPVPLHHNDPEGPRFTAIANAFEELEVERSRKSEDGMVYGFPREPVVVAPFV